MDLLFEHRFQGRPAIKKNNMMIMRYGQRSGISPNARYRAWEQHTAWALRQAATQATIKDLLTIEIVFHFKNKQHEPDVSNCVEGVQDVLAKAGVIGNDKQIRKLVAEKVFDGEEYFTVKLYRYDEGKI